MEQVGLDLDKIILMIRHEDDLRDQRLGWLFALDGFLFATLGIVWGKPHAGAMIWVLAGVGVFTGLSAVGSMQVSDIAIGNLRQLANCRGRVMGIQRGCFGDQSSVTGMARLYPWHVMPWGLVVAWFGVVVVHGFAVSWW